MSIRDAEQKPGRSSYLTGKQQDREEQASPKIPFTVALSLVCWWSFLHVFSSISHPSLNTGPWLPEGCWISVDSDMNKGKWSLLWLTQKWEAGTCRLAPARKHFSVNLFVPFCWDYWQHRTVLQHKCSCTCVGLFQAPKICRGSLSWGEKQIWYNYWSYLRSKPCSAANRPTLCQSIS